MSSNPPSEKLKTPDGSHTFWDIFTPGAKLGVYHFDKYDKDYVYVQMPESKAKVFVRCCVFLTIKDEHNPKAFAIVHRWNKPIGGPADHNNWEPIKGQVEQKEMLAAKRLVGGTKLHEKFLNEILFYTIQREVEEEAKILPCALKKLKLHREIAYQSTHSDYPEPNMYFQYMIFTAEISRKDFEAAQEKVHSIWTDPRSVNLRKDEREKNGLALWSPQRGLRAIMGGPAGALVRLYLRHL
jgi:hypothetical protein